MRPRTVTWSCLASLVVVAAAGCGGGSATRSMPGADPTQGRNLIGFYGCGTCHVIGGIATATGRVGPSLRHLGSLSTLAGKLPNTPDGVERWIMDPQRYVPGNAMPDLGVSATGARDIAAYLYQQ